MILVLQTAAAVTNLWLVKNDGASAAARDVESRPDMAWQSNRELADGLLEKIIELVDTRGTDHASGHTGELKDLTGIIVFSGPGSFTSLRIGHTVANALADGLGTPVVGVAGDAWIEKGLKLLPSTPLGQPALPVYGGEANVTQPKR